MIWLYVGWTTFVLVAWVFFWFEDHHIFGKPVTAMLSALALIPLTDALRHLN